MTRPTTAAPPRRRWALRVARTPLPVALLMALACAPVGPYESAVERGEVALTMGESEDAADAYRMALASRPADVRALHGLARTYLSRGDGEDALEIFFHLKGLDPVYFAQFARADYHYAFFQAGRARLLRNDPATALRYLRRLQAENPSYPGLPELLTRTLIAEGGRLRVTGEPAEAEALFREARGRDPGNADPAIALAEALIEGGQVDTAVSVLSDALFYNPDDKRLRKLLGRALQLRYPNPLRIP